MGRILRFLCSFGLLFSIGAFMISPSDPPRTQWIKYFRPDVETYYYYYGKDVRQTIDGGFIIAGSVGNWEVHDFVKKIISQIYLIRTDRLGNVIWQKTYKNTDSENAYSVLQTADGGFMVVGWTVYFGAGHIYLMKVDSGGNFLWHKTYGENQYNVDSCLEATFDGQYIIAGTSYSTPPTANADVYLIKIDGSGNLLWQKTYGGAEEDRAFSVKQTMDGGFIIAGYTRSFGSGNTDVYLLKTDGAGTLLWQKTFGGNGYDYGRSVCQTYDGGYVVAGETSSFGSAYSSACLVKVDGAGNFLWQKIFGETRSNGAYSVSQTFNGGLIIAGYANTEYFGKILIRTDRFGNLIWQARFQAPSWPDVMCAVRQTYDLGFIATGDDLLVIKLAPDDLRDRKEHRR